MKCLVVVPTYNEAKTISKTLSRILEEQPEVSILVVDDSSPDGTAQIVQEVFASESRVSLLARPAKLGLGPAYLAGFSRGLEQGYEVIVEMDADGSHRAEDLAVLLSAIASADLVIGSRWIDGGEVRNWSKSRRLISRIGNRYARWMLGTGLFDMTSGFRAYRSEFLEALIAEPVSSHGYSFQIELAYRAASLGRVVEVPITFVERADGESKMTLAIVLEALTKVTFWGFKRLLS